MIHRNPTIAQDTNRIFNFKSGENISEVSPIIQPVIQITRVCNIVRSANRSATGSANIFTTPADKDFYITSVFHCLTSDATADNTNSSVSVVQDSVARNLIQLNKTTLTAYTGNQGMTYVVPIKLDRGTNISHVSTFTVGTASYHTIITGYTVETVANSVS